MVMIEATTFLPLFKMIEADTAEQAEQIAEAEAERLTPGEEAAAGWLAGEVSTEYDVKPDATWADVDKVTP
jgi:hypothetical protein